MNTLYLVECNYGRYGNAFRETDRDSNSRAAVIALIRSGEVDPIKVLEVNEDEGTCRDVTDELIRAADRAQIVLDVMSDRAGFAADHIADYRKHSETV